jgi:hypothetical protein
MNYLEKALTVRDDQKDGQCILKYDLERFTQVRHIPADTDMTDDDREFFDKTDKF